LLLSALLCVLPSLLPPALATDATGRLTGECRRDFKVALDIGHTLSQPGATSANGITEFHYNRRLAQAAHDELTKLGVLVVLSGADGGPLRLGERTRLAKAARADLFLSLHHDSVQPRYLSSWAVGGQMRSYSDVFRGYSVFVSGEGGQFPASLRFASLLGGSLLHAGLKPSLHHAEQIPGEGRPLLDARLGIYRFDQLVVLRTASMPAALLEAAVIVNREEEEQAQSPVFLQRLATAIARSVREYCSLTTEPPPRIGVGPTALPVTRARHAADRSWPVMPAPRPAP